MRGNVGFTLIEILVYLSLLLLISVVLGRISRQLYQYSLLSRRTISRSISRGLLFDQLRRDFLCADPNMIERGDSQIIFRRSALSLRRMLSWKRPVYSRLSVKTRDLQFWIKNGSVFRCEGDYDYRRHKWIGRRHVSKVFDGVAGNSVSSISVELEGGTPVTGIKIFFVFNRSEKKSCYVRVRNGLL